MQSVMRRNLSLLVNRYIKTASHPKFPVTVLTSVRWESNEPSSIAALPNSSTNYVSRGRIGRRSELPILHTATPQPTVPLSQDKDELMLHNITAATSIDSILNLVVVEKRQLKIQHIVKIFRCLFELQKHQRTKYEIEKLQHEEGFVLLCHSLRKLAPHINSPTDLINCLKTLMMCEVDSESRVILTLISQLKAKVNDLSLRNISYLEFLLNKMPKSSLIEALKIALPMVFESNMETQLELDNRGLLLDAFQYACIHRFPQAKIQFIVQGLFASDPNSWSVHQVLSVLRSMDSIRNLTEIGLNPLLEASLQRLAVLVDECKPEDLLRVMTIIKRSFSGNENRSWFNQSLCEKLAERIVRERWPLEATSRVSWAFNVFPFAHSEFMEYLANIIVGCKSDASLIDPNLLLLFASTSYKPRNLETMMEVLLSSSRSRSIQIISHIPTKNELWFRFIVCCAVLNIYPIKMINQIFDESFIAASLDDKSPLVHWIEVDRAIRSVRIECSDYKGPFPDFTLSDVARNKMLTFQNKYRRPLVLEKVLQTALGGSSYIASGLMTRHGHHVDHALVMRPGGFPVAINLNSSREETLRYVEDIAVPNGCQLILLQSFGAMDYVINCDYLRGIHAIDMRTLERLGYDVIAVNTDRWLGMLEHERIPFLMREIHHRLKVQV